MAVALAVAASDPRVHVVRKKGESEKEEGMEIVHNSKMVLSVSEWTFLLIITIGFCDRCRPLLRHWPDDSFARARSEAKKVKC